MKPMGMVLLLSGLAACGGLEESDGLTVWKALEAAGVAAPVPLSAFTGAGVFAAPVQCNSGAAQSSVLQTHAFAALQDSEHDGSATGMVRYTLTGCRSDDSGVALGGTLQRGFYAARRVATRVGEDVVPTRERFVDAISGTVALNGQLQGTCRVDVTRTLDGEDVNFDGTVCDFAAARVLKSHRPHGGGA